MDRPDIGSDIARRRIIPSDQQACPERTRSLLAPWFIRMEFGGWESNRRPETEPLGELWKIEDPRHRSRDA